MAAATKAKQQGFEVQWQPFQKLFAAIFIQLKFSLAYNYNNITQVQMPYKIRGKYFLMVILGLRLGI